MGFLKLPTKSTKQDIRIDVRQSDEEREVYSSDISLPHIENEKRGLRLHVLPRLRQYRSWKPLTQEPYFLLPVCLASIGVVLSLQILLLRSQRDNGIIFASDINSLPAGQTFCYLYLPTIVSLTLGFTWTWIDLDIRRLQPFWQLSRLEGASGKDSILLEYPVDFVAFIPFKALRKRHWPVFFASLAVVLITWGLTPLQSAIFATETVIRNSTHAAAVSKEFLSLADQGSLLTSSYTQSCYSIAWQNETLPPFMSRDAMLAPFGFTETPPVIEKSETWTAHTRMYSVDITCHYAHFVDGWWVSNNGCRYMTVTPPTVRPGQYESTYVGYWYEESMDEYLSQYCGQQNNGTFLL
ncbi:hypothetical protein AAFC00_003211 [Neodothiora populina]|uniref:Uncharacterized protein n=1 Tax=Neodothiora populina TaxID=2781224 RepID=A0ABR3PA28_9PEZI